MCGTRLPRLWEGMQSSVAGENTAPEAGEGSERSRGVSLRKRDCGVRTGAAWCGQGGVHVWV